MYVPNSTYLEDINEILIDLKFILQKILYKPQV